MTYQLNIMISETSKKPMVVIESPFRGRTKKESELFKSYAQACMEDSIKRQEVPFASHLLYTQVLNDGDEHERNIGISLNLEMLRRADKSVVYTDLGISAGTTDKVWRLDKMRNLLIEIDCIKSMLRDVR